MSEITDGAHFKGEYISPTHSYFFLEVQLQPACRFKSKREWHGIRKANDGSMKKTGPSIIHMTLGGMSWMVDG